MPQSTQKKQLFFLIIEASSEPRLTYTECVDNYIANLRTIPSIDELYIHRMKSLRNPKLHEDTQSQKVLWLGANCGTTGSTSLQKWFTKLNITAMHCLLCHGLFVKQLNKKCENHDHTDFRHLDKYDIVTDTPMAEFFLDYFLTYPNAKVFLVISI